MSAIGSSIVLFLGCSLVGWVLVGVALHTRQYQKKKELTEQSPATGTIVDSVRKVQTAGRGHPVTYYVPVVEFKANQHAYRLEYENGNRHKENIVIGQTVDLMYDPKDPTHYHLTDDDSNMQASRGLLRYGSVLIAGAAVLTVLNHIFHIFW